VPVSHKAVFSLLISVILFAVFSVLAYTGIFDLVEARFYNPSIARDQREETALDAELMGRLVLEWEEQFAATLDETAVRRSFLPTQSEEDIFDRSRIFGLLQERLRGLQWVRFVDMRGSRLHFSTAPQDILRQDGRSLSYRNYPETEGAFPFDRAAVSDGGPPRLNFDGEGERFIFSFPFYDSFSVYRGTALFSLSVRAAAERFIAEGRLKAGEDLSLVPFPPGLLRGLPRTGREFILPQVSSVWQDGAPDLAVLDSISGTALTLVSAETGGGIYVGRLVDESLFAFPRPLRVILLASAFLTVFLTVFLLFNLRQDAILVIRNRLKRLQFTLIGEYYERKEDLDWDRWSRELDQRRDEIRTELKRGVKFNKGTSGIEADFLINRSWDEMVALIGGRRGMAIPAMDREKLQALVSLILQAAPGGTIPPRRGTLWGEDVPEPPALAARSLGAPPADPEDFYHRSPEPPPPPPYPASAPAPSEPLDLEELEGAEDPGEDAEVVEELEPAEEPGEVETLAAVEDPGEYPEEVEELETMEDPGDVEELEAAEPEELGELEDVEKAELLEEVGDLEELEDAEKAELDGIEDLEVLEDLERAELLAEVGDLPLEPETETLEALDILEAAETGEEATLPDDLEIVSPFSTIFSDLSPAVLTEEGDEDAGVEDTAPDQAPLAAQPSSLLKLLETARSVSRDELIEDRDGVHYVKEELLHPSATVTARLDPQFKELIDSVILR
jgi:hypothetical protein